VLRDEEGGLVNGVRRLIVVEDGEHGPRDRAEASAHGIAQRNVESPVAVARAVVGDGDADGLEPLADAEQERA
jgi:hypothetical protein